MGKKMIKDAEHPKYYAHSLEGKLPPEWQPNNYFIAYLDKDKTHGKESAK
jgi:hypothetical protein